MKKLILKTLKIVILMIVILLTSFIIVFYKSDLSIEYIESKYFTENSYYLNLSVTFEEDDQKEIKVHYQDYGIEYENVIVLLHGAFSSSHTFIDMVDDLLSHHYRVIMIDLPYHGLTLGFDDQITSIKRSAIVVKSLLDNLEISEFYIAGNSMGGGVSYNLAGLFHNDDDFIIKGIIFIDSIYPQETNTTEGPRKIIELLSNDILSPLISKLTPRFLFKFLLEGVYGNKELLEEHVITRYYEILRREGNRLSILRNKQENLDYNEQLSYIDKIKDYEIPVLVLWGKKDTWISYEVAYMFKERLSLENNQLIFYEDLGHVPMEEDPNLVLVDIIKFLSDNS